jgi:flagellar motility protein MotE (MotC chaperone)
MVKWIKRLSLLIAILAVLAGAVYALDWLGIYKFKTLLVKIPGGDKITAFISKGTAEVKSPKQNGVQPNSSKPVDGSSVDNKLQLENQQLKTQIKDFQKQLETLKVENKAQLQRQQELEQKILNQAETVAKEGDQATTGPETAFKQLAKYYAEMKPKEAVAIMDMLDDDTVIGILINLESDQTAKILATMEPKRAARLVNKLAL